MKVLSLFDGISCGQIALERAEIHINNYMASEIDKNAIAITQQHYPNTIQLGDVNQINFSELTINLLIGGSPCQDLSKCNIRNQGLQGERSGLFFKYIEALRTIQPRYYLFENVGSMTKNNMEIISEYFGHYPRRINSNLVSPQNRERYYWTNIEFEPPEDKGMIVRDILENKVGEGYFLRRNFTFAPSDEITTSKNGLIYVCGVMSREKWLEDGKSLSRNFSQGNRVYSINGKSCSINANSGGLGGKSGLYYLEDGEPFSRLNIRRLTPLEVERLQTLPDNYTAGIPETKRYECIGNGWTVDVIAHIFKNIREK